MNAYCLELDCPPPYHFDLDGRALYLHRRKIRAVMHNAQLPSLERFCLQSSPGTPLDSGCEANDATEWFAPQEGLDYLASLSLVLNENAENISGLVDIKRDIALFERDLQRCLKASVNWRLVECEN